MKYSKKTDGVYPTRIKDWAPDDRPREKLERHGPSFLSDAELLAILINTGTKNVTAIDLAKSLIHQYKNLPEIARRNYQELSTIRGIGKAKAIKIMAAFEIARRVQSHPDPEKVRISSPEDIAEYYMPHMRDLKTERFMVLLLDSANQIMKDVIISEGTLNASLVHPREVFKAAIDDRAASVILIHNHPSGYSEPSHEDLAITEQMKQAGKIMGIPVRDHIIIAGKQYYSMAQKGYL
jgi:DNA repair protein RadC